MEEKPASQDLRLSMLSQPGASGGSPPPQPPAAPPWQGYPPPSQTEIVEERGLTGYRVVGKLIDTVIIAVLQYILFIPINIIWVFSFTPLTSQQEMEQYQQQLDAGEIPWELFGPMLIMLGIIFLLFLLVGTAYYFCFEYISKQTLGKKAFNLKVSDPANGKASAKQILARSFITVVSMMFYLWIIELIVMLVRPDGRRIADLITGTTVVQVKTVYYYPPPQQGQ